MIILNKIDTANYIKELLAKDDLYKDCFKTDALETISIDYNHHVWFEVQLQYDGYKTIGIIWLTDFTHNCVTFHGGLFKEYRSSTTPYLLKQCLYELKTLNPHITFITTILKTNIKAIKLIESIGFKPIMTIVKDNLIVYGDEEVIIHG
jgi:hypothetical protein